MLGTLKILKGLQLEITESNLWEKTDCLVENRPGVTGREDEENGKLFA